MTRFLFHTLISAPAASRPLLASVQSKYGMLPNLAAGLAEAPNVLKSYVALSALADEGTLSPIELQIVQITTSRINGCHYCVAAHSTISDMHKLPAAVIDAVRNDQPIAYAKHEALRQFTKAVVSERGWIKSADIELFLAAGYTKGQALEVILSVALKVVSNYANHIMDTPVDKAFEARAIKLECGCENNCHS